MKRFQSFALCLGFAGSALFAAALASTDPLSFSNSKLEQTPLGLIPPPAATTPEQPKSFNVVPRAELGQNLLKRSVPATRMPIIVPNASVDYKLMIKKPDPSIDYKLLVGSVGDSDEAMEKPHR